MNQSIAGIIYVDGKYLIGLRLPSGEMGNRWEFPGGKVDQGETAETAILREFREEMGISVTIGECITSVLFANKKGESTLCAYQVFIPDSPHIILTEHSEIKWASMEEIEALPFVDSDKLLIPYIKKWYANVKNA